MTFNVACEFIELASFKNNSSCLQIKYFYKLTVLSNAFFEFNGQCSDKYAQILYESILEIEVKTKYELMQFFSFSHISMHGMCVIICNIRYLTVLCLLCQTDVEMTNFLMQYEGSIMALCYLYGNQTRDSQGICRERERKKLYVQSNEWLAPNISTV